MKQAGDSSARFILASSALIRNMNVELAPLNLVEIQIVLTDAELMMNGECPVRLLDHDIIIKE